MASIEIRGIPELMAKLGGVQGNGIRFVMRNNSEAKKTADNLQESLAAD